MAIPIGQRIRRAREYRRMSQVDLAKRLGITRQNMWNMEFGRTVVSVDRVREIAQILRVSGNYLLGLSEEMEEESPALVGQGVLAPGEADTTTPTAASTLP